MLSCYLVRDADHGPIARAYREVERSGCTSCRPRQFLCVNGDAFPRRPRTSIRGARPPPPPHASIRDSTRYRKAVCTDGAYCMGLTKDNVGRGRKSWSRTHKLEADRLCGRVVSASDLPTSSAFFPSILWDPRTEYRANYPGTVGRHPTPQIGHSRRAVLRAVHHGQACRQAALRQELLSHQLPWRRGAGDRARPGRSDLELEKTKFATRTPRPARRRASANPRHIPAY